MTRKHGRAAHSHVQRAASVEEVRAWEAMLRDEDRAVEYLKERIVWHKVPITLRRAEYQFDKAKLTFHFTSD
eukprot:gene55829-47133_t